MPKEEAKGVASYLMYGLGFPLGIVAIIGAFCVLFAVFRDEISLGNKRFTLGMALLSLCAVSHHVSRIYPRTMYDGSRWYRSFSLQSLLWTATGIIGLYYFIPAFISLMRQ